MGAGVWAAWAGVAVSLILGVWATIRSRKAQAAADRSAHAAKESAEAGQRSADVAERAEARQTERNDVVWRVDYENTDEWALINDGEDVARSVLVVAHFDDDRLTAESDIVRPGESVSIGTSTLISELKQITGNIHARERAAGIDVTVDDDLHVWVAYRVTWTTANSAVCVIDSGEPIAWYI